MIMLMKQKFRKILLLNDYGESKVINKGELNV